MSAQDNLEWIQRIYAAFGAGDIPRILSSIADDAEWIEHGPRSIPYAGIRSGKQKIGEFFQTIGNSITDVIVTPERFVAQGDVVVMIGSHKATVRRTGAQIDTRIAHVFTLLDGKIVRWEGFSDTAQVAAAHIGTN